MKSLNLTDIQYDLQKGGFEHFIRVDNLFIGSIVESPSQVSFIKSLGVENVIDLKFEAETSFDDKEEFEKAGLKYFRLPIDDLSSLTFEKLQEFKARVIQSREMTLIYCMSGNRVGALLALHACEVHPKN
jgi:protein tyrosine phosphatase (PTP) superfamily phosphohydrolase (DUF442 family)